jgi:segregation and condensation protein A
MSIEDKIAQIKNLLNQKKKIDFYKLINDDWNRHEVILTFLAVLELLKQSFIKVQQHAIFGKIVIIKNIKGEKVS